MISTVASPFSLRIQFELLGVSRQGWYHIPAPESLLNLELMRQIDTQFLETPFYGVPRMHAHLRRLGYDIRIKANRDRIELFYLPRYSPELNPDEYLNQDLKTNAVGRKSAKSKDELKNDVISFLKNTKSDKEKVKRYFNAEKVQYAS
jgi:hypothetical protein